MSRNEHWLDRLSEHLDGELSPSERAACEAHLAGCRECAVALEELRAVVAQASLLPSVPPERDLWPEIEARLTPRGDIVSIDSHRRRIALTVPQLAAAAVVLMVVSAGTVWLALPGSGPGTDAGAVAGTAPAGAGAVGGELSLPAAGPQVTLAAAYDPAISQLEQEFQRRRSELDPETIRVVEENLAIIDLAIAEAGKALAKDPGSAFLNTHLAGAMRRKVDLLRRVTTIERTES